MAEEISPEAREAEEAMAYAVLSPYRTLAYAASLLFLANVAIFFLIYGGTASFFRGELIDAEIRAVLYLLIVLLLSFKIYHGSYNALKALIALLGIIVLFSSLLLDSPALVISVLLLVYIYFNWQKLKTQRRN